MNPVTTQNNIPEPFKSKGFILPPPKAKFHINQEVYVLDKGNFTTYHSSKLAKECVDNIGVIKGYKNVPRAYSKYLVEFPNNKFFAIHSHFLYLLDDPAIKSKLFLKHVEDRLPEINGIL